MFTFCIQKDTIKVEARDFGKDPAEAIRDEIHRRYANKVLPDVGLCISLLDIISASEGAVLYGDGCFYYKTVFRLIIFRPFVGEAFLGKVISSNPIGLTVSVGFFDDILVPPTLLPDFCVFDPVRQRFFWAPADSESTARHPPSVEQLMQDVPMQERMYIENREWIKLRVAEEMFDDTEENSGGKPVAKTLTGAGAQGTLPPAAGGALMAQDVPKEEVMTRKAPYSIIASMNEPGLGCLDWWADDEADEDMEQ